MPSTSTYSLKELFLAAYNLILDPIRWCQGVSARNAQGKSVLSDDFSACQWCSTGAINHFARCTEYTDFTEGAGRVTGDLLMLLDEGLGLDDNIAVFNDTHTHEEVIAHWKKVGKKQGWL